LARRDGAELFGEEVLDEMTSRIDVAVAARRRLASIALPPADLLSISHAKHAENLPLHAVVPSGIYDSIAALCASPGFFAYSLNPDQCTRSVFGSTAKDFR
jgi:hypothetical protein